MDDCTLHDDRKARPASVYSFNEIYRFCEENNSAFNATMRRPEVSLRVLMQAFVYSCASFELMFSILPMGAVLSSRTGLRAASG